MEKIRIAVLGSTGSIGTNALDVIRRHPDRFDVCALTAHTSVEQLLEQAAEFHPEYLATAEKLPLEPVGIRCGYGPEAIIEACEGADVVLLAIMGMAGLPAFEYCLRHGIKVALATKEAMVCGGRIVRDLIDCTGTEVLPVDSELSAILQAMQGHRREEYAKEVAQVIADGNEIGTHTWSHNNLTKLSAASIRSNLQKCIDLTYQMTGQKVTLLRPPGGNTNKNARSVCGDMGLYIVNWSVDSRDWESRNASKIYNEIMKEVGPGAIVLCHDIYSTTAAAMERVIPELVRQGYQIVTVSELLACRVDGVQPGIVYTRVAPYNLAGYEPAVE